MLRSKCEHIVLSHQMECRQINCQIWNIVYSAHYVCPDFSKFHLTDYLTSICVGTSNEDAEEWLRSQKYSNGYIDIENCHSRAQNF
jgi:hypothetical protein